jgi:hypothetical protein
LLVKPSRHAGREKGSRRMARHQKTGVGTLLRIKAELAEIKIGDVSVAKSKREGHRATESRLRLTAIMLRHKHPNSGSKGNSVTFCAIDDTNESADRYALLCCDLAQEVPELLFQGYTRRPIVIPNIFDDKGGISWLCHKRDIA